MPRAVRFDAYGGVDVLKVVNVERPAPGPGEVLVRVKAAGINPGEGEDTPGSGGGAVSGDLSLRTGKRSRRDRG